MVKAIHDVIDYATNGKYAKECADAFKAVGATPIAEQVDTVMIATENVIKDKNNDHLWATGNLAAFTRDGLTSTTNDLSFPVGFIGITNRAILATKSSSSGDDYFSVILVHSFIHSGGILGQDNRTGGEIFWGNPAHDLRHLGEKYKDILKYCTREQVSRGLGQ